jgi:hypothetical protein
MQDRHNCGVGLTRMFAAQADLCLSFELVSGSLSTDRADAIPNGEGIGVRN